MEPTVAETVVSRPRFVGLALTLLLAVSATAFGATHHCHRAHRASAVITVGTTHGSLPHQLRCHPAHHGWR